jgi:hypothetical protein
MSAPARRPRASGSCWGTRLGYRPSNGYNAPGPLPRSALAASGVEGVGRCESSRSARRRCAWGAGAALTYTVAARCLLTICEPGRQRELTLAWNTDKTPY